MHTSSGSRCAKATAAEMLSRYAELGYSGVVLTDHFFNSGSSFLRDSCVPWSDRVSAFNENYLEAKAAGETLGLDVFFGLEFCSDGCREQLVYGVDADFVFAHSDLDKKSVRYLCDAVREYGGITSLAHPFRQADYINSDSPIPAKYCDCIEVYNYCNRDPKWNRQAYELARSLGKGMTAGSDAHNLTAAGRSGIACEHKIRSYSDLVKAIKDSCTRLIINSEITDKTNLEEIL